ncbi:MAG: 2'-5' RNA ligase family protein [Anaerolineaceae bacterium]
MDRGGCQKRLEAWAAQVRPLPISFQNLGIFPAPGAVVTQELLALQREVDGLLEGCCTWPAFNYYRPGHWIPHCTLAMEFDDDKLPKALDIACHLKLPLNGLISGVGVIEFRPVKHLFAFPLADPLG